MLIALCCCVAAYYWRRSRRQRPLVNTPQSKDLMTQHLQHLQQLQQLQEQEQGALPLVVSNPLAAAEQRRGSSSSSSSSSSAPVPATTTTEGGKGVWRRFSDHEGHWFVNSVTGESEWELPEGAVLAEAS